jgi:hypothetical protein
MRYHWDILLVVVVLITSVWLPTTIAFQWQRFDELFLDHQQGSFTNVLQIAAGVTMELIFVLDVIFNLNCGYVREHDYVCIPSSALTHISLMLSTLLNTQRISHS